MWKQGLSSAKQKGDGEWEQEQEEEHVVLAEVSVPLHVVKPAHTTLHE